MAGLTLRDLVTMSAAELDRVMQEGHPIDEAALEEREYDGVSLNLPSVVERLTWTKFCKVFHRDPGGALRGWNCRVVQTPLDEPWELERRDLEPQGGAPKTYGHYVVRPTVGYRIPRPYGAGLLLDYGLGKHAALDPTARVRDPIVAVNAGSAELLLGWSYLDLGVARVGTPSYFALRRGAPLSHVA